VVVVWMREREGLSETCPMGAGTRCCVTWQTKLTSLWAHACRHYVRDCIACSHTSRVNVPLACEFCNTIVHPMRQRQKVCRRTSNLSDTTKQSQLQPSSEDNTRTTKHM